MINNRKNLLINNLLGWLVFVISLIIYTLTLEPTVSWWDCSEIITSGYKLEVGHPPGAPFHMLLSRFFSMFAPQPAKAAVMVNFMSAVASAATIMLLYWIIVHLVRKLHPAGKLSKGEQWIIWGSGIVGSLAFAFTDTFWFSAVEGEVYALSSFFTAAVFWSILKWEESIHEPQANRWLILIAYLIGLSIGVHLLSLLVIPVIGLVWFFKMRSFSWYGLLKTLFISGTILVTIQYFIIPETAKLAFFFDRIFVNSFGLPFNSGVIILFVIIFAAGGAGIFYTRRKKLVVVNTAFIALLFIYIGYTSYAIIIIRSSANPPMNQNHPDNAFALHRYLAREQYGDRPFLFGPYYNAPVQGYSGAKTEYNKVNGKYQLTATTQDNPVFDPRFKTFFPRMYSTDPMHIEVYRDWGKIKGIPYTVRDAEGTRNVRKPTFTENIRFFKSYQLGYMYFRYFMWNFAGRQNDKQGQGGFMSGNWISGIPFIDNARTGPQKFLPPSQKNDPSRNAYFFLPLLLGIAGMFYQYGQGTRGRQDFWIVMLLFLMTGIAIVIYLNQTPVQPRERDYAYVGSFFAFSIWIGIGVSALFSGLKKVFSEKPASIAAISASVILVPGILLSQNFRDHNRSGRYMARDYAKDYLESCAPNAILFTYGDNDTFPLWYVQEVERVRPDIRIINLGLMGMDWYISQLKYAQNDAPPVPFSWEKEKYYMGRRDAVLVIDKLKEPIALNDAMAFAARDDDRSKVQTTSGELYNFLPSQNFYLPVDKGKIISSGLAKKEDESLIADTVRFTINKQVLMKSEIALLNIIAANNWDRPIYFNQSILYSGSMFLYDWLQLDGFAFRLVPLKADNKDGQPGRINTDVLYENLMNKFTWGNVNDPGIYLDEYNKHEVMLIQARPVFTRLAAALNDESKSRKAEEVLDRMFEIFPDSRIPLTSDSFAAVEQYYRSGAQSKGNKIVQQLAENSFANLNYYLSLPEKLAKLVEQEQNDELALLHNLVGITKQYDQNEMNESLKKRVDEVIKSLSGKIKS